MYPNQPPEQQSTPQPAQSQPYSPAPPPQAPQTDTAYFDSIATPTPQKTISPLVLWGGIGGVLLLLIGFVLIIASSGGMSKSEQFTHYVHRVQALAKLTKGSSKTIKSSELRALSASTTSILVTADQESTDVLSSVELKKIPSAPKDSPITTEFSNLDSTLNDARLNVTFDRVYSREVGYQLAKIRAEMSTLYESSRNDSLRDYLERTDANLKPLVSQYNEFNNSQS